MITNQNETGMETFSISFVFNHRRYMAKVVKSEIPGKIDYTIRQTDFKLIQEFGEEVIIFKEDGEYAVNTAVDDRYSDYVNTLINAIRLVDLEHKES